MAAQKPDEFYEVSSPDRQRKIVVKAANSTQAKRKACKYWGYKPGDSWVGISSLKARKIPEV